VHAALIMALIGWWNPVPPPEPKLPVVRLVIEGPGAAGEAGGVGAETGQPAAGSVPVAASDSPSPQPPTETATAAPEPQQLAPPQPAPVPTPPPVVTVKVAPEAVPPPLPQHKPEPPHPAPAPAPAPTPAPAPAAPMVAQAAPAPLPTQASPGPPAPSSGSAAGPSTGAGAGAGAAGPGHGAFGNGRIDGPGDDYLERAKRRIAEYKHYPPQAVQQKEEGTALLDITVRRDGQVLDVTLRRSSGFPLIDQAALAAVRAASPLPPFPATTPWPEGTFTLPFAYTIGFFDRVFR
jgi:protein TonB